VSSPDQRPTVIGDAERAPTLDELLEALAQASVGRPVRLDVDPRREEPLAVIGAAVNILLEDLRFRQDEREEALQRVAVAEAKREFLAYLSHDMQTPLALLLGSLELLGPDAHPDDLAETVPIMRHAVRTLERLIQQFLDLARLDGDRPLELTTGPLELRPVLDVAVGLFADRGGVDIVAPAELPAVRGDPGRIEQIVSNLLSNAYKYAADPIVAVEVTRDGGHVDVTIADRGEGLSDADLDHVFGQFERAPTSTRAAGSGLGLFISRALAEAMGGSLTGRSDRGVGSRFTLRLPVVAPPLRTVRTGDGDGPTSSSRT
jgi:signal transduction histidine kinase